MAPKQKEQHPDPGSLSEMLYLRLQPRPSNSESAFQQNFRYSLRCTKLGSSKATPLLVTSTLYCLFTISSQEIKNSWLFDL